jgi:N-acetylglucosaminyldiphosphoundecaprenol N-acetyl-beta-D-mannosaminyltransferase
MHGFHIQILGYNVCNLPAQVVASSMCDGLDSGPARTCVFLNPHSLVMAQSDPVLKHALSSSSVIFCDGVGLSLACVLLNRRRIHRVFGHEFFLQFSAELSRRRRGKVFFLGGVEESLHAIVNRYSAQFPGCESVSSYAPPFKAEFSAEDIEEMRERIRVSGADVLWVGLGSPKQEKLLHRLVEGTGVRVAAAIGAVFDFYSGRVPQAPAFVRRMGLEWVHRLVLDPARLWRRTFISAPLFLTYVAREMTRPDRMQGPP